MISYDLHDTANGGRRGDHKSIKDTVKKIWNNPLNMQGSVILIYATQTADHIHRVMTPLFKPELGDDLFVAEFNDENYQGPPDVQAWIKELIGYTLVTD